MTVKPFQVAGATSDSLRMCSSFETSQYVTNNSGEIEVVASDSMSPLLTTGDVVAVKKGVAFEDLRINEIIVFKDLVPIKEEESVIISRINEILLDPNDDIVLVTKGDANSASIPGVDFPIYKDNFVGRVSCFLEDGQLKR
jgi:signal peptidase